MNVLIKIKKKVFFFFFFNDTATTEIYTLSLHDALPIWSSFLSVVLVGSLNSRQLGLPLWAGWIVLPFHRAAGARSQRLSGNRAWGRGSPGARGEGGQRPGSAPGAGRSRAARVGSRVVAGMGGGPSCAPGIPTAAGKAPGAWQGRGGAGRGSAPGGGGGGLPRCPLGGRRGGWERPLRALLGPQGSASSGRGGGVRTTGQGTGTAWSREPRSPPSVVTTWRSHKGLAVGLKARSEERR